MVLFTIQKTFCQNNIKGKIINQDGQGLSSVNILLKDNQNKTVSYSFSNSEGFYEIKFNKTGNYILIYSSLNYKTIQQPIEIVNEKTIEKNIILEFKAIELNEVVVNNEKAITIKKDTIIFNAKSFTNGTENVVEDLLKKIPGINVSDDGTIKVGNQEVEKIMIDGDDFFEKGYKILSKNMPANPISKIELYQNYSNNKLLKNIEDSNKVAINLKLNENSKRQWFGNAQIGYGLISENRYNVKSNLMNFGKKNKYYFITNLNNDGSDSTGDINNLIYSFNETENIGNNQQANPLINLDSYTLNLKLNRINFNNAEMLSLNNIINLSDKTKIKFIAFLNSDENDFYKNSSFFYKSTNNSFENQENSVLRAKKKVGFGKLDLTSDFSKNKLFEYSLKFNNLNKNTKNDLMFNENLINENLKDLNQLIDQKITLTNRFNANTVLLLTNRYINEKFIQEYSMNNFTYQDLFSQSFNNINQFLHNEMSYFCLDSHLLSKKGNGNLLDIQIGNEIRSDKLNSQLILKEENIILDKPLNYQNDINYIINDTYIRANYGFNFNKSKFITHLDIHKFFNKLISFDDIKYSNPIFINPSLVFDWRINKKNKLITSLSYNKTNSTVSEVFNNYINISFRNFSKGTGSFNQLDTSSFKINYNCGNWGDKFFMSSTLFYSINNNFISSIFNILPNISISENIILKNKEMYSFSLNIDKYFRPISSNLKLILNGTSSNYKNIVNDSSVRKIQNNTIIYGFELRSAFKGFFNYHFGSKWTYTLVEATAIKNTYKDNISFADLTFIPSSKINFKLQTESYYFGNIDKNNNIYNFIDFEAKYIVKQNKLSFSIFGNNLTNTTLFKNYSVNDLSIYKTEIRLQPRYLLFKIDYRF